MLWSGSAETGQNVGRNVKSLHLRQIANRAALKENDYNHLNWWLS
jgi:hypothetical protein